MTRPVIEVVRDIQAIRDHGLKRFYLIDDNIVSNPRYLEELCEAVEPLHMEWATQCSLELARYQVPGAPVQVAPSSPPSFVELRPREWLPQAATACRIELSDPAGAKMTLELPCDSATVVGVAQAFWRRA